MDQTANRIVLVTGGGTGIGRATALAFADQGATVFITGRRVGPLERTSAEQPGIHPVPADLTTAAGIDRVHEEISRRSDHLDVLVNNAAVPGSAPLADLTEAHVRTIVESNLVAPMLLTARLLPSLVAAAGVIVNISTSIGGRGWPGGSVYAASKAGVESLTRSWAVELAPSGVRVVGVAPGAVDTPMADVDPDRLAAVRDWQISRTPIGRLGRPEEIATAVVALASSAGSFVTGATLAVDGGAVVA